MATKRFFVCVFLLLLLLPMASPAAAAAYPVYPAYVMVWGPNGSSYNITMANGIFEFNILPEGNYSGLTYAYGFLDRLFTFNISAGSTSDLGDIFLLPGARVSGYLIGPNSEPIADAVLYLLKESNNSAVATAWTTSNGSFVFDRDIPTGTYFIRTGITNPGYTNAEVFNISATSGQTTSGITVQAGRSGTIAGTVKSATNVPVDNAMIGIYPPSGGSYVAYAYTDSEGKFNQSYGIPAGTYNVSVLPTQIAGYVLSNTPEVQVTVVVGQTSTANFVLGRSASISGVVTYQDGKPAEGIPIQVSSPLYWSNATTDENGSYTVDSELEIAEYTVMPDWDYLNTRDVSITALGQNVTGIDFQIYGTAPSKAWIIGNVTSSDSGSPLPSVSMAVNGSLLSHTSSNGSYAIEVELPDGIVSADYNITAYLMGYYPAFTFPVNAVNGTTTTGIDFSLAKMPTGALVGRIVSEVAPSKTNAAMTIQSSSASDLVGSSVTLSGTITPSKSGSVTLYTYFNGSLLGFDANVTLAAGSYARAFNLTEIGTYSFYSYWSGDDSHNPATSPTITVASLAQPALKTTPAVVISASKSSVFLDTSHTYEIINITGTLSPFTASTIVNVKVAHPNAQTATIPITATASSFSAQVTINMAGSWSVQAFVPDGDTYNAASSNTASISATMEQQSGGGIYTMLIIAGGGIATAVVVVILIAIFWKRKFFWNFTVFY